jgi:hypothetical protein
MLLAAMAAVLLGHSGCFQQPAAPPAFRFSCGSADDCEAGETCLEGLCQVPCTFGNAATTCFEDGYLTCWNGGCASACPLGDDGACPGSQTCIDLGLSGSSGGFGGGSSTAVGICGTLCTADSCPAGEACFEGACLRPCGTDADCGEGEACTFGFCGAPTGDGADATTGETEGADAARHGDWRASFVRVHRGGPQ